MADTLVKKSGLKVNLLNRETLQDRVYRRVCDLILDGEISPGQLVTIQSLADAFGVSHMPVREALKRLTAANALTVISGRSIGIPRLSRSALDDVRNVRLEIESLAAVWAARRITEDELLMLGEECRRLESADAAGDVKAYLRANHAFHFSIYRAAGSGCLLAIIENLWLQISPYFNLLRGSGNYSVANAQHQVMVDALKLRDEVQVERAIRADIDAAYGILVDLVE
ncbi:MAG: GntR family transcriptional regulator [Aestuariivirga sp.]|nr:GntR family transcriptional regulator [Aestuariivirga sp.]